MQGLSRRRLLALGATAFVVYGCSAIPQQRHLELQRPDETLIKSRAGRFSVQVIETPAPESPRGSQGRFEWLQYQSGQSTRSLLLIIGPFGQSLGGIEKNQSSSMQQDFTLSLFDEQGFIVEQKEQWRLLSSLAGRAIEENSVTSQTLNSFMGFVTAATASDLRVQEIEIPLADIALRFRIALDAQ